MGERIPRSPSPAQACDGLSTRTDLGSVLTGPGTYDDPIADRPRQFYRLAKP